MRYLLLLFAALALAATPAIAQNSSASANYGEVSLGAGFYPDPHTVSVRAGGPVEVDVPGCGFGYVSSAPDYKLHYSASGVLPLTFGATSGHDTTILVNLPNGSWACNDDGGEGRNPLLTIPNAPGGRYDIWVGTFSSGDLAPATLFISERTP